MIMIVQELKVYFKEEQLDAFVDWCREFRKN